jgi:hypothetical protein
LLAALAPESALVIGRYEPGGGVIYTAEKLPLVSAVT